MDGWEESGQEGGQSSQKEADTELYLHDSEAHFAGFTAWSTFEVQQGATQGATNDQLKTTSLVKLLNV